MKRKFSILLLLAKIAIACFTMGFLVKKIHFHEIRSAFQNPENPLFLVFAVFLVLPNLFLQWFRWHTLMRRLYPGTSPSESAVSLFGGMVGGFVTPGRIGEFSRPLFLKNVDRFQVLGLVLIDKLYAFIPILVGGLAGVVSFLSYAFRYNVFLVWPLSFAAVCLSGLALLWAFNPAWTRNFLYHLSVVFPTREKLRKFIGIMDVFTKRDACLLLAASFLLYAVYISQFCLLAFAFQPIPWTTALTATTCTLFAKTLIPFSIGDLGIREGAAVFFFLRFHVDKVTAFNSSLLLFAINIVFPTLLGLLFLPKMAIKN